MAARMLASSHHAHSQSTESMLQCATDSPTSSHDPHHNHNNNATSTQQQQQQNNADDDAASASFDNNNASAQSDAAQLKKQSAQSQAAKNRVSKACQWCRRRKRRCDGLQPCCTFCSKSGLKCEYAQKERKRGPEAGVMKQMRTRIEELELKLNKREEQEQQQQQNQHPIQHSQQQQSMMASRSSPALNELMQQSDQHHQLAATMQSHSQLPLQQQQQQPLQHHQSMELQSLHSSSPPTARHSASLSQQQQQQSLALMASVASAPPMSMPPQQQQQQTQIQQQQQQQQPPSLLTSVLAEVGSPRSMTYLSAYFSACNTPFFSFITQSTFMTQHALFLQHPFERPPLPWLLQYCSSIAIGAAIYGNHAFAAHAAAAAREASATIYDEAHFEVLRGLLLQCYYTLGQDQPSKSTVYLGVVSRTLYALQASGSVATTSYPTQAECLDELRLLYSFHEDMSVQPLGEWCKTDSGLDAFMHRLQLQLVNGGDDSTTTVSDNKSRIQQVSDAMPQQPVSFTATQPAAAATTTTSTIASASLSHEFDATSFQAFAQIAPTYRHYSADECTFEPQGSVLLSLDASDCGSTAAATTISNAAATATAQDDIAPPIGSRIDLIRVLVILSSFRGHLSSRDFTRQSFVNLHRACAFAHSALRTYAQRIPCLSQCSSPGTVATHALLTCLHALLLQLLASETSQQQQSLQNTTTIKTDAIIDDNDNIHKNANATVQWQRHRQACLTAIQAAECTLHVDMSFSPFFAFYYFLLGQVLLHHYYHDSNHSSIVVAESSEEMIRPQMKHLLAVHACLERIAVKWQFGALLLVQFEQRMQQAAAAAATATTVATTTISVSQPQTQQQSTTVVSSKPQAQSSMHAQQPQLPQQQQQSAATSVIQPQPQPPSRWTPQQLPPHSSSLISQFGQSPALGSTQQQHNTASSLFFSPFAGPMPPAAAAVTSSTGATLPPSAAATATAACLSSPSPFTHQTHQSPGLMKHSLSHHVSTPGGAAFTPLYLSSHHQTSAPSPQQSSHHQLAFTSCVPPPLPLPVSGVPQSQSSPRHYFRTSSLLASQHASFAAAATAVGASTSSSATKQEPNSHQATPATQQQRGIVTWASPPVAAASTRSASSEASNDSSVSSSNIAEPGVETVNEDSSLVVNAKVEASSSASNKRSNDEMNGHKSFDKQSSSANKRARRKSLPSAAQASSDEAQAAAIIQSLLQQAN